MNAETCAVVILAAGGSTRLGRPKQLLRFQQKSLIKRLVSEAKKTCTTIVVVTGFGHDQIVTELKDEPVLIAENNDWTQGMGTSLQRGMQKLKSLESTLNSVLLTVCDQPFVNAALFTSMMDLKKTSGKKIVACSYAGSAGTPALFDQLYFDALQQLNGREGAKKLIQRFASDAALMPFPQGAIDIDTQDDYEALLQQK
jgi:molybdenum cofactor cytidylyltransferase